MGTPQGQQEPAQRAIMIVGYVLLFVLGALQGMIGSFNYSRSPVPLVAIILALLVFATCVLAGWGMGTFGGGLAPAIGWIIASFVLSMGRPNGSIIITGTSAGEWYLYGGSIAAVSGAAVAYILWARARVRSR
jgi:peptidoglycan/LPS O-acetylase OafA/YrhL